MRIRRCFREVGRKVPRMRGGDDHDEEAVYLDHRLLLTYTYGNSPSKPQEYDQS